MNYSAPRLIRSRLIPLATMAIWPAWVGAVWASPLPETPVNSWTFFRNDGGAELSNADMNTFFLGSASELPNSLSGAGIVGTWGSAISLQIGEVARVSGSVLWTDTGNGSSGLRFGLFNSDGTLLNGSPGYAAFLDDDTDNTFDRITAASTSGPALSPLLAQNLNATVFSEQGTWQDGALSPFAIEVERTGSDIAEIRFLMSSESGDPVNIDTVATHSGGSSARTFDFNAVAIQFSASGSNAPDSAVFFDVNISVGMPGDFNHDSVVDAADYAAWRKLEGTPVEYADWRANFGRSLAGSGGSSSIPEATGFLAVLMAATPAMFVRRKDRLWPI